MAGNSKEQREKRIKFITDHAPECLQPKAEMNRSICMKVERLLLDNNFYSPAMYRLCETTVVNLIREAQGKKIIKSFKEVRAVK